MKDMQLLTEKDLEYFRKKAEEGSAVILELSEEQLLRLDFSYWTRHETNTIKESEVMEWLHKNLAEFQKIHDDSQNIFNRMEHTACIDKKKDAQYSSLAEWLQEHELSDKHYEVIQKLVQKGFTEEQLLILLSEEKGIIF